MQNRIAEVTLAVIVLYQVLLHLQNQSFLQTQFLRQAQHCNKIKTLKVADLHITLQPQHQQFN